MLAGYQRAQPALRDPLYFLESRLELSRARAILAKAQGNAAYTSALNHYSTSLTLSKRATRALGASARLEREARRLVQVMKSNQLAMAKNLIIDALNSGQRELATRLCAVALKHYPRDLDFKQYQRASVARR